MLRKIAHSTATANGSKFKYIIDFITSRLLLIFPEILNCEKFYNLVPWWKNIVPVIALHKIGKCYIQGGPIKSAPCRDITSEIFWCKNSIVHFVLGFTNR